MARKVNIKLSPNEREILEGIISRGSKQRRRQRAQTLIELDDGKSTAEITLSVGIHRQTVANTRKKWLLKGLDSLDDSDLCGAPRKITSDQMLRLVAAARNQHLTARELLFIHLAGGGTPVHLNTLSVALRAHGIGGKRTRKFLETNEERPLAERCN